MANMNVRTPRFYVDTINYLMSRGVAQNGEFDVTATGGSGAAATRGIQTGSEIELFDMNPLNKVDFDTSGDTDSQVLVTIDTQSASSKKNFIAILNHNLGTAVGKIRIFCGDEATDVTAVDSDNAETSDVDWSGMNAAEVVNADLIGDGGDADGGNAGRSLIVIPASDGSTIFTFNETNMRYWAIQFEGNTSASAQGRGDGTWGSTDLFVGNILIGEYFDAPHAPDMSVKRSIDFDKVKVLESTGGQRFSNMVSHGRTSTATSKSPFTLGYPDYEGYGGRISYEMNFSFLNSSTVMPNRYLSLVHTDDTVVSDVWNKTNGPHIPFIFSCDNSSTGTNAESEHIFARFAQNSLNMSQVANDLWNVSLKIEEEF